MGKENLYDNTNQWTKHRFAEHSTQKRTEEYTSVSTLHGIISRIFLRIETILSHGITINNVNHTKYGLCHPNHVN